MKRIATVFTATVVLLSLASPARAHHLVTPTLTSDTSITCFTSTSDVTLSGTATPGVAVEILRNGSPETFIGPDGGYTSTVMPAEDGSFTAHVYAFGPGIHDFVARQVHGSQTVESSPVRVVSYELLEIVVTASPDVVLPKRQPATITATGVRGATATFFISDGIDPAIRRATVPVTAGAATFVWDGTDDRRRPVRPGIYSIGVVDEGPCTTDAGDGYVRVARTLRA